MQGEWSVWAHVRSLFQVLWESYWARGQHLLRFSEIVSCPFELKSFIHLKTEMDAWGACGKTILSRWNPLFEWLPIESVIRRINSKVIMHSLSRKMMRLFLLIYVSDLKLKNKVQDRIDSKQLCDFSLLKPKRARSLEQVKAFI